jgi:hypothetical protein
MSPSDQCFNADDASGLQIHLRLINEKKLIRRERLAQFSDQIDTTMNLQVHSVIEEPIGVTSFRFRTVKRHIRAGEQSFGAGVGFVEGNTNADVNAHVADVNQERQFHHLDELLSQYSGISGLVEIRYQHAKLVATEACDNIRCSDIVAKPLRYGPEQTVAGRMAQCVVNVLEIVEIKIKDSSTAVPPASVLHRVFETGHEDAAICQSGQRVGVR